MSDLRLETLIAERDEPNDRVDLNETLEIAGNSGLYQKIILCLFSFVSFSLGVNFIAVPFLFYHPQFKCKDIHGNLTNCSEKEACSNAYGFVVESEKISLTTEYQIYCDNAYKEEWAKAFLYFWVAILVSSFSMISDKIGRRKALLGMAIMYLVASAVVVYAKIFEVVWFAFCCAYATGSTYFSISSIYFTETSGVRFRNMATGVSFSFFAFGCIMMTFIFMFIEKITNVYYISMTCAAIWIVIFLWITETPYFLLTKGRRYHLMQAFSRIIKFNHPNNVEEVYDEVEVSLQNKKVTVQYRESTLIPRDQQKKIWVKIGFACLSFLNCCSIYYLSYLVVQAIGFKSIYIGTIFMELAELAGNFTVVGLSSKLQRRFVNILTCIMQLIFTILFLLVEWIPELKSLPKISLIQAISSIFVRYIVVINYTLLFTYATELVPTLFRGRMLGSVGLFNKFGGVTASFFEAWSKKLEYHPFTFSGAFSLLGLLAALMLPETLNKPILQ